MYRNLLYLMFKPSYLIMENNTLSERELRRYKNQMELDGIGEEGQRRLKKAKILVIGAGGKGTSTLKNLMTAGVGYIGVSDDTLVQEDTLGRQSLYNDNDIGKQKAIVSKQYLQARNRFTQIKVHNIRLIPENLSKVITQYNVLVDATNNFESHYAIGTAARQENIPLIVGHIANNKIYISAPKFADKAIQDILNAKQIKGDKLDSQTPIVVVNSFAGNLLANEAIKIILEKPSQLNSNLLIIKLSDYSFTFQPH